MAFNIFLYLLIPQELLTQQVEFLLYIQTPKEFITQQVDTMLYMQTPREQETLPLDLVPMMLQTQKILVMTVNVYNGQLPDGIILFLVDL